MREIQIDDDPELTAKSWSGLLSEGCDFDSWGQPVEAVTAYSRLKKNIDDCVVAGGSRRNPSSWDIDERQERCVGQWLCSHVSFSLFINLSVRRNLGPTYWFA